MSGGGILHRLAVHLFAIAHRIPESSRADGPRWGAASDEEKDLWHRVARASRRFLVEREGHLRAGDEAGPIGRPTGPAERPTDADPY